MCEGAENISLLGPRGSIVTPHTYGTKVLARVVTDVNSPPPPPFPAMAPVMSVTRLESQEDAVKFSALSTDPLHLIDLVRTISDSSLISQTSRLYKS